MPPVPPDTPPPKRVRLMPWRGPLHFLLLLATSSTALTLPLVYFALVLALGGFLVVEAFMWIKHLALAPHLGWQDALPATGLAAGVVTWLFMFRPLLSRPPKVPVALQATPASQPAVFEMVDELCWHLKLEPPAEIWLDATTSVRCTVKNGVMGVTGGEMVLNIGLPLISVMSVRELAALLVRELALNTGGLGTTLSQVVRELNLWFYRALHERDPWEMELREPRKKESSLACGIRMITWVWMAVAKLPFALFVVTSRVISAAALMRLAKGADEAALNLIGRRAWTALRVKTRLMEESWKLAREEIKRGLERQRLPENLALLLARNVARLAKKQSPGNAPPAAQEPAPRGQELLHQFPADAPAASKLRGFVDLARQVTSFYYQHELGIGLHEHRLVADEEALHQTRREDESLVTIRRYFGGLAHPERAICGLGATHPESPGRERLIEEIRKVRAEMAEWGGRLKLSLKEWNLAWQRRRDLEAAATLSLAGFTVSRIQFGTEDTTPQSLRSEAARQRMIMEHVESALVAYESKLESRFAAALGLLWWSDAAALDDRLLDRRRDLPGWVSIYEAMAAALPAFRELLTTFFAFQTLGARYANPDDTSAVFTALQSVVPKMTNLARQIQSTLDGAIYPFTPNKRPMPLNEHLLQGQLPEGVNISMNPGAAVDMKAMAAQMATQASDVIAPFVDRFLSLYHRAFAWLAESAELTENRFMGPLNLGTDIELLMPEEFAKMRETQPLTNRGPKSAVMER